jgi:circadian clock protein KaiC
MSRKSKTIASFAMTPLPKVLTGIRGFDEITGGGLPVGRTTLVRGGPGCGKTVFAIQTLFHRAKEHGEAGILVAFEEHAEQIVANAATMGWNIPALAAKKLFLLDGNLAAGANMTTEVDLAKELNLIARFAAESNAKYIVFDGIDVLLRALDNPMAERREIYRLRDWILESKLTAIITQKSGSEDAGTQSFGVMQFMADCVITLDHHMVAGSSFRDLRVAKYRGSGFLADEFPITINDTGMHVSNRGPVELRYDVTHERVSSGLPRLDTMLSGGYHRSSNVLISGAPGTAKSTLAALFVDAACQRGERAMYVSFDEGASQIVRNVASVGIHLKAHEASGLLKIYSTRTRGPNIEQQFSELRHLILAHRPRCLVIDPLSAMSSEVAHMASADATQQFLDFLKTNGITVISTSLLDGPDAGEATATGISTIADTWIHVSYVVSDGERNRALTIVKSRGTGHSNQVRELVLSDDGVTLADVYSAQGHVLMGVARWQQEQSEAAARQKTLRTIASTRVNLKSAQAEAEARLAAIATEIELRAAEMALLDAEIASAKTVLSSDAVTVRKLRYADIVPVPLAPASAASPKNGARTKVRANGGHHKRG